MHVLILSFILEQRESKGLTIHVPRQLLVDLVNGVREEYLLMVGKDIEFQKTQLRDDIEKIDVRFSGKASLLLLLLFYFYSLLPASYTCNKERNSYIQNYV